MKMTYENVARCPNCLVELQIFGRVVHPQLGALLKCRCPHCGSVHYFSEDRLKGSAKQAAETMKAKSELDASLVGKQHDV